MKKQRFSIIRYLMVALFVCYYVENTAFIHTHHFRGYDITHSHPYTAGHTHNQIAMETIALLNASFLALPLAFLAVTFVPAVVRIRIVSHCFNVFSGSHTPCLSRAPPFV